MVLKSRFDLAPRAIGLVHRLFCIGWILLQLSVFEHAGHASIPLIQSGKPNTVVILQPGFTKAEEWAARDLTNVLRQITSQDFQLLSDQTHAPGRCILIGTGPLARALFPKIDFDALGPEEIVLRTQKGVILLAGGRPRGTIYAVSRFMQESCKVRWWAPWSIDIPKNPKLKIGSLNVRETPAFESRDTDWHHALTPDWAIHNFSNSRFANLGEDRGGAPKYGGFVHTFYELVPPEKHYKAHPEWFSLVNGERISMHGQLCLSDPHLKRFVVEQVKARLRELPQDGVVSVSQNDCYGNCQCEPCRKLDQGNPAGSLLCFVNDIAESVEKDFPNAAIETLAYQYTRKPPQNVVPRKNVIIRLCSIECNFAAPFGHNSNLPFAQDVKGWSKICKRLYIWDYTVNFDHYLQPFPNWFSLGPNLRFLHQNNVQGVFAEGDRQSSGGEMAELRAWILTQLMWNPKRNDRKMIDEFLRGYYGEDAARPIKRYLELLHAQAKHHYMSCFSRTDTPFLDFPILSKAERLWQKAEKLSKTDCEKNWRVRMGHLSIQYVWLKQWTHFCDRFGADKVMKSVKMSRSRLAREWLELATGQGPRGWSKVTHVDYLGKTPESFIGEIQNIGVPENSVDGK